MIRIKIPGLFRFQVGPLVSWGRVRSLHLHAARLQVRKAGPPDRRSEAEKALDKIEEFQAAKDECAGHSHVHTGHAEGGHGHGGHGGMSAARLPGLGGHTHTHGSNPLLVLDREAIRRNAGVKITWIGLLLNVGLATGKFVGGVVFHSQALIADAVHAVSDLVSDFLTLFSVSLASRKPTQDFPYGYGKVETVGSLAVSSILAMAGLSIGWSSLYSILGPVVPHALLELAATHSHSHAHTHDLTNINAAWIAGGSIILKEWIFRATRKVAQETHSNVLMANAWHHRVDSLTSLVALVTISSGYLLNIQSLDAFGGLLVSGLVVKAGYAGMKQAASELVDRCLPPTDTRYADIHALTTRTLEQMISNNNAKRKYGLHELTVLASGPNTHAHLVLEVPRQRWENVLSIDEFELVTEHLRSVLYEQVPHLRKVHVEFFGERSAQSAPDAHTHTDCAQSHTHKH
ncbi:AaceriAFL128Cp [[Ashbya] aceris (nom. inval.)]|nr:AaceriAFL128Cp [[Ashbya] aceris (nom. inval.)]